ncbi:MAG: lamin tail domain-containing protein [Patescibacteria group bacterium]|nr:lamin tail domain-containing protein [Patescibacteria group bacterium]
MFFRKKSALVISAFILSFFIGHLARAMPVGTLLYRTSSNGNLYGYNTDELVVVKNKMIKNIYTGHTAIYIGQENGVDYIVEAMPDGVIKIPAKYFLNSQNGERLIGAKIPKNLSESQRIKVVELVKQLAESNLAYDFDFKYQKGPASGEWTCVGLVEKVYESANISNPLDISKLEYDSDKYAIDITPDGFDNFSVINNETGDCLSRSLEFSKISADRRTLLPLPEIFGFNAGKEYNGERYFFFPLTQYFQESLEEVKVDIDLESGFSDNEVRGKIPEVAMIFRWSLINNPSSALRNLGHKIASFFSSGDSVLAQNDEIIQEDDYKEDVDSESLSKSSNNFLQNSSSESLDSSLSEAQRDTSDSSEVKISLGKVQSSISISDDLINSDPVLSPEISKEEVSSDQDIITPDLELNSEKELDNDDAQKQIVLEALKKLVISKIYATGNNDYIEIYNPSNQTINLSELDLRLYKTKTSASPSLISRLGNIDDASYPGGLVIAPQARYLVVRSLAEDNIKNKAQAIVSRNDFSFTGNGYTIYLSNGVVSSDDDVDIIDKVGYGSAKYFLQQASPEILDNYVLTRQLGNISSVSKNNYLDFTLVALPGANIPSSGSSGSSSASTSSSSSGNTNSNNSSSNNTTTIATSTDVFATSTENIATSTTATSTEPLLPLLISKIYTTDSDDYVEIYNPNNQSINLEESGIRLYKAKTSSPSLMMRLGNLSDGSYPGGLIISPYGKYLIARSSASDSIKSQAQAISERSEFSLTGEAYTVYLSNDAVSEDDDSDIIDKVGYGLANYYFNSPASEIFDNHLLVRKATATSSVSDMSEGGQHFSLGHGFNSWDNSSDFVLLNLGPDIPINIPDNNPAYCLNPGIYSDNIIHLWHLDECSGTNTLDFAQAKNSTINSLWHEGKFGCGLKQYFSDNHLQTNLDSSFNSNNWTLSFYYNNISDNSRPEIKFANSVSGDWSRIRLYPGYTDFYNIPKAPSRDYNLTWPNDNIWHLFTLVVNKPLNYLAIYRDGEEIYRIDLDINFFPEVDEFYIKGDNGYNLMDEIAIFNRALSPSEIANIYNLELPLNCSNCNPNSSNNPNNNLLQLIKHWDFNEESGNIAYESLSGSDLNIAPGSRVNCGNNGYLNLLPNDFLVSTSFDPHFYHQDLSMSFWLRNSMPLDNPDYQFLLSLISDDKKMLGLEGLGSQWYYYFNDLNYIIGDFSDDVWHQIILSYNLYLHRLSLFIDGELINRWFHHSLGGYFMEKIILEVSTSESYYFDELGIWQGAFSESDANSYYNSQKSIFID